MSFALVCFTIAFSLSHNMSDVCRVLNMQNNFSEDHSDMSDQDGHIWQKPNTENVHKYTHCRAWKQKLMICTCAVANVRPEVGKLAMDSFVH